MDQKHIPCPNFRKCGGCQLQNLPYAEQLLHKQRRAVSVLGELGHVENIIGMDEPAHYRNKVTPPSPMTVRRTRPYPASISPAVTASSRSTSA